MGRFASTVPYYRRYRPPYPPAFFRRLARTLGLDGTESLIDLGCGPGPLALGFAPFVGRVVGVDPEPAMLAAAREAATAAGVRLRLIRGRTETLPRRVGRFDVVTIGRALHWMARKPTLARLAQLVRPGGCVLVCGASPAEGRLNPWLARYERFRHRLAPRKDRRRYGVEAAAFFAGSGFVLRREITVNRRHRISVDILVGRMFSMSNTSPQVLGAQAERAAARLRTVLAGSAGRRGAIDEVVEARAAIFCRPGPRAN
ncbi:MAG TPA: class I SAM-dependent methyltransferase [Opitutaceae bacterium]|nr:class I SAM-dependent methyltransferase [Opitutaceae bacterium]